MADECCESLEMLKSQEGQLNAVFACFGSAAQHSQFFEEALADLLLLYNKVANTALKIEDFEAIEEKLQRKTMGALLTEFKKYVSVNDSNVEGSLATALQKRNFLIHQYFRESKGKFSTEVGRMEMLAELVEIGNILEHATNLTNGMRVAIARKLGYPDKSLEAPSAGSDDNSEVLFTIEIDVPE